MNNILNWIFSTKLGYLVFLGIFGSVILLPIYFILHFSILFVYIGMYVVGLIDVFTRYKKLK